MDRRSRALALPFALLFLLAWPALGESLGVPLGLDAAAPAMRFAEVEKQSLYVPMGDGVRLAVDLYLPAPRPEGETVPAVVEITRYWRAMELIGPLESNDRLDREALVFARHGFAYLKVDARGTGASFGSRPGPLAPREVQDGCDLVRWIVEQPWSSGKVGAHGVSYSGSTAALMGTCRDPAVGLVIPRFNEWDVYTDIAYPGGVFHEAFVRTWAAGNDALDRNKTPKSLFGLAGKLAVKGVAPVDGPNARRLLDEAVQEHLANVDVAELAARAEFRDRRHETSKLAMDDFSLHSRREDLEASPTSLFLWGSWLDAGTAQAVLAQVMNLDRPLRAVIGPWNHGADQHASPYLPSATEVAPRRPAQMTEMLRAFAHHLRGEDNGFEDGPRLLYYTLGEERWKTAEEWPPPGFEPRRWYFQGEGGLAPELPPEGPASDTYAVDFTATTGTTNRWTTQHGDTDVDYGDRRTADERLLTYTSDPLHEAIEITGHPVATLHLTSSTPDGAVYVYLEDVAPDGRVRYVTEGQLRLAARHLDPSPPYDLPVPQPSFRGGDARPMVPGEAEEVIVPLLPTSVVIAAGHRLRIALAGHDADTFQRIPARGEATYEISRHGAAASYVELPVKHREGQVTPPALDLGPYGGRYRLEGGGILRVLPEPPFLRLSAENQAAADLLTSAAADGVPDAERFNERVMTLIEALRSKDKSTAANLVRPGQVFDRLWKERKRFRKAQEARILATTHWLGQALTTAELRTEEGWSNILFLWHPDSEHVERWGMSRSLPAEARYLPRKATPTTTLFEAFDPSQAAELRFRCQGEQVLALEILGRQAPRVEEP